MLNIAKTVAEDGQIKHYYPYPDDREGLEVKVFRAIKGGLSWPGSDSPGYYIILGEEDRPILAGRKERGKLILFTEKMLPSVFPDVFCKHVTDDCSTTYCQNIYTSLVTEEGKISEEVEFYRDWKYRHEVSMGNLQEAPYSDNFALGISYIRQWIDDGLLELPKDSLAWIQLINFSRKDLDTSDVEERFFAINALRFVIASFHKSGGSGVLGFRPQRQTIPGPERRGNARF